MNDKELRFEEKRGMFLNRMEDVEKGAEISTREAYVSVYSDGREIAQIRESGNITYGERRPGSTIHCVTLSPEQRREIDAKADEFQRKCNIEVLAVTAEIELEKALGSKFRFEEGKRLIWEMRKNEEDGVAEQETLTIFFGRDEIGFITGDGKLTTRGTWNPEDHEFLAQKAREYRAQAPRRALADRHAE